MSLLCKESNARVKKEVIFDEDSETQETRECASINQERSRHRSNNCSFYVQEDDMEDEKPSTPRRRDWYQKDLFPIIANRDNSSSPIDSLYIDLERESSGYDCYKTNAFPTMAYNSISPSTSKIVMGQIDPIGFQIKKELLDETSIPTINNASTSQMSICDAERKNKLPHPAKKSFPISYQIKKEMIEDSINRTPEPMDISEVRKRIKVSPYQTKREMIEDSINRTPEPMDVSEVKKRIKVSPQVQEKYRLDYKIRKEPVEQEDEDVEILFETSFKNIAASSWSDCVGNFSPKSSRNSRVRTEKVGDSRKINLVTVRKSVSNPITFDDLLNDNGILKFPEEEDVYYDKCLLENSDLEWMDKDNWLQHFDGNRNTTGSLVPNEDIGKKIQVIRETVGDDMSNNPKKYSPSNVSSAQRSKSAVKRKYSSDIESLCADLDKQVALRITDNKLVNLARKQFPDNQKGSGDIESICVGMDKHVNVTQRNSELVSKQVSALMLAPPGPSSSKVGTSSAVGNRTLVKILPPPRIEPRNIERLKIVPEQNSVPKPTTMKRLEGNQTISDDALKLLRKNYDADDDPFFLHEGAKDIVLTQAIGNSHKCNLLRV